MAFFWLSWSIGYVMSQEKSKRAMASLELMAAVLEEAWEESCPESCSPTTKLPWGQSHRNVQSIAADADSEVGFYTQLPPNPCSRGCHLCCEIVFQLMSHQASRREVGARMFHLSAPPFINCCVLKSAPCERKWGSPDMVSDVLPVCYRCCIYVGVEFIHEAMWFENQFAQSLFEPPGTNPASATKRKSGKHIKTSCWALFCSKVALVLQGDWEITWTDLAKKLMFGHCDLRFCCFEYHQCCFRPANNEDGKLRRGTRVQAEREGRMVLGQGSEPFLAPQLIWWVDLVEKLQ